LKELLPQYFDAQQGDQVVHFKNVKIFDPSVLIKDVVRRLYAYEPTEKRNGIWEDYTLIGLIDVITILIERCPTALAPNELEELAIMLLEQCLFSLKFEPI
jgi:hypothetical protein